MEQLMRMGFWQIPSGQKKGNTLWHAIFNPQVKRILDIDLLITLRDTAVVRCVKFSADGKYVATGSDTARIYDAATGHNICILRDENAGDLYKWIRTISFSKCGKMLATGSEDFKVRIWDIAQCRIKQVFESHLLEIYYLQFSDDSQKVISGSEDKTILIGDIETGETVPLTTLEADPEDSPICCMEMSPDGSLVAAGCFDRKVRLWDVASGNLIERLGGHLDMVWRVAFTPDGKGLVIGGFERALRYWNLDPFLRSPDKLTSLAQKDRKVCTKLYGLYSWLTGRESKDTGFQEESTGEKGSISSVELIEYQDDIFSVATSPVGPYIASGSKDGSVKLLDPRTLETQLLLRAHQGGVCSIAFSPVPPNSAGTGLLATASEDRTTRVWRYIVSPP